MLSREVARREAASQGEKDGEERAKEEEDRRQKGRALLQQVPPCPSTVIEADYCRQRQQLLSQIIMDACDVWIPATNVGYTHLNDGVLGSLG